MSGLRGAFGFLTVLGGGHPPTSRSARWFPVVGAVLGLALGVVWWGAERLWPAALAAALVVLADLVLTGMLHLDGLADSADGLLAHLEADRRLEVMARPDVGAFGVGAVAAVLLVRWAALAAVVPAVGLLVGLWVTSRSLMALALVLLRSARAGSMADLFRGDRRGACVAGAAGLAAAGVVLVVWAVPAGPAVAVGALAGGACVLGLSQRRLGGATGDVLGAAGMLAETVGLVVAGARW